MKLSRIAVFRLIRSLDELQTTIDDVVLRLDDALQNVSGVVETLAREMGIDLERFKKHKPQGKLFTDAHIEILEILEEGSEVSITTIREKIAQEAMSRKTIHKKLEDLVSMELVNKRRNPKNKRESLYRRLVRKVSGV